MTGRRIDPRAQTSRWSFQEKVIIPAHLKPIIFQLTIQLMLFFFFSKISPTDNSLEHSGLSAFKMLDRNCFLMLPLPPQNVPLPQTSSCMIFQRVCFKYEKNSLLPTLRERGRKSKLLRMVEELSVFILRPPRQTLQPYFQPPHYEACWRYGAFSILQLCCSFLNF